MIYRKNKLTIDGFVIDSLARKFKTPLYCYSLKKISSYPQETKVYCGLK